MLENGIVRIMGLIVVCKGCDSYRFIHLEDDRSYVDSRQIFDQRLLSEGWSLKKMEPRWQCRKCTEKEANE